MPRTPSLEPSDKQKELLAYILQYVEEHCFQPSQTEMAEHFKVTKNAITGLLEGLANRGWVDLSGGDRQRAIGLPRWRFHAEWLGPKEEKTPRRKRE
jgi:DNA-binding IclR family transcriptional regulator